MADITGKDAEEIWIGDVHVANIRQENGHGEKPYLIEGLTGKLLHASADRHAAELWITMHSDDITERELG
ncbi:hypothetical protein [Subtercola boreus]|uniref:Uncharacterized protein n=1 Tax=Subtercola boreus TaxID=120213 RepID=A0A3E0WE24_9MICO|nr:hypothetical protein [Subtercola boreus]RFA22501.1 hypothetical protein B7R24_02415 [Subtercola boreus]RFA23271.1 hypothetical protein B7R23_02405 [Subtercola boreus]RFA29079.1 hypothetical protein B7R25_02420 [Subtercola boreus]